LLQGSNQHLSFVSGVLSDRFKKPQIFHFNRLRSFVDLAAASCRRRKFYGRSPLCGSLTAHRQGLPKRCAARCASSPIRRSRGASVPRFRLSSHDRHAGIGAGPLAAAAILFASPRHTRLSNDLRAHRHPRRRRARIDHFWRCAGRPHPVVKQEPRTISKSGFLGNSGSLRSAMTVAMLTKVNDRSSSAFVGIAFPLPGRSDYSPRLHPCLRGASYPYRSFGATRSENCAYRPRAGSCSPALNSVLARPVRFFAARSLRLLRAFLRANRGSGRAFVFPDLVEPDSPRPRAFGIFYTLTRVAAHVAELLTRKIWTLVATEAAFAIGRGPGSALLYSFCILLLKQRPLAIKQTIAGLKSGFGTVQRSCV